jgi:hypothetical protein
VRPMLPARQVCCCEAVCAGKVLFQPGMLTKAHAKHEEAKKGLLHGVWVCLLLGLPRGGSVANNPSLKSCVYCCCSLEDVVVGSKRLGIRT